MKTIIIAILLTASFNSLAEGDMHKCGLSASMYETVASWRDINVSPEKSLEMSKTFDELPIQVRKKIINTVYFDPGFERAGGPALRNQMMDLCLHGPKNWKPLK